MSIESTTYTVAALQLFFFFIGEHRELLESLSNTADYWLITITFCLIMFRLLFYNMHVYISWCYKSSFINISCQFVRLFFFSL